jgi:hypothetical protein
MPCKRDAAQLAGILLDCLRRKPIVAVIIGVVGVGSKLRFLRVARARALLHPRLVRDSVGTGQQLHLQIDTVWRLGPRRKWT